MHIGSVQNGYHSTLVHECILLWPLVAPASRASVWQPTKDDWKTGTYHIDLSPLNVGFNSIKEERVKLTPFNPLASVRCAGQQTTGQGVCADMFVTLDALSGDLICGCGKHSAPPHWREYFQQRQGASRLFQKSTQTC